MKWYAARGGEKAHRRRDCNGLKPESVVTPITEAEKEKRGLGLCEICGYDHLPVLEDAPPEEGRR